MLDYKVQLYRDKFAMVWREGGTTRRHSLGTTDRAEAHRLATEAAGTMEKAGAVSYPVLSIWNAYRETLKGRPAYATMDYEAKALMPTFGHLLPAQISEAMVRAYVEARRVGGLTGRTKRISDGTIRTELTRLGCALNFAVKKGWIAGAPHLPLPPAPPPHNRHLTKEEATRFLDALDAPHARLFVILALTTAARKEALLTLTWDRVDMERRRIRLLDPEQERRMKGRATVPVNDRAYAALVEAKAGATSARVLTYKGRPFTSLRTTFAKASEKSEVHGVSSHVFRHTAAVWMAESRVPMEEIAQYLGHADYKVTERVYARFSPDYLRNAATALDF